ncbi:MAG TPA: sigma-70 family RNA polymerase sigma factor [Candidatus Acidoferrum sp.]|nr:sigma-70 family RNA polymerase sigma factor [Candidatus Acidoferrum sp.]
MNATKLDLLTAAKAGDKEALGRFFEQNQGLVRMAVGRFLGRGTEYDDLFQIGSMAFVKAVKNFDLTAGVQFSTYAVPVIIGELRRHFRDTGPVRISRGIKEQARRLSALQAELSSALGREPTISEIAAAAEMEPSAVVLALDSLIPVLSLSYTVDGEGEGLLAVLGHDETDETIERVAVTNALSQLSPRERKLLLLRYYRSRTQQETAAELGISQVQVSRLEKRALAKLREII